MPCMGARMGRGDWDCLFTPMAMRNWLEGFYQGRLRIQLGINGR